MPHFISKDMFIYDSDIAHDDFIIKEMLVNKRFNNLFLIPIIHEEEMFFIRCVKRANDFLYKVDKITRPSNLLFIKKVLQFIASHLNVITHNLNQTQNKHTRGMQLGYLVNLERLSTLTPDYIEIGFGSGRHILDLAKKNPQKLILGFEIHTPSVRQVINAIELHNLENLFVCDFDARLGIQALSKKSVETIFLHFPVPWNKAKHRRVFHREFLENSFRILKDTGHINLRSDDYEYVLDSMKEAMSADFTHFEILKNRDIDIVSKYEARWSNMKKDIYEMRIFQHDFRQQNHDSLEGVFSLPSLERKVDSINTRNQEIQNLDSKNMHPKPCTHPDLVENLESTTNCHVERSETSNIESTRDFSCLRTQNDKKLNLTKNTDSINNKSQAIQNLDSKTYILNQNLESNLCHVERSETSNIESTRDCTQDSKMESKKDFSPFSKAQNDKFPDSNTTQHNKILESLCNKKWIQDSIFISIGDIYSTQSSASEKISIANLTFGSFYMPFNTYLILDSNHKLHYLKKPLSIRSHLQAHKFLCKILQEAMESASITLDSKQDSNKLESTKKDSIKTAN
ncbi:tRNA (guanosine(46)-N7)-methyltransferase TrmB [Helicobacter bilis]|uniref:tRNA (guanosine(46)-N7)-methyltransferase TrmB n=1 Tax=Helicobacter bilis TaxID=37372 RepID=UPI001F351CA2|nr:tRNA (guanosine(46)-N7)-methyltransferase TrmB [Helicobacter bilis]